MITAEFLENCKFKSEDIPFILESYVKYGNMIAPIAVEYMETRTLEPFVSYTDDEMMISYERAVEYLKKVKEALPDAENYAMCNLVFWICCLEILKAQYVGLDIDEKVFFETAADIAYKVQEHKIRNGECGIFEPWVCLVFDVRLFVFGRLQYQPVFFSEGSYQCGEVELKKGDRVFSCHIPSSGPLTEELCIESFQGAYEFFKDELKSLVIPIVTRSYLIYPPYCDTVFVEGSNTYKFIKMFDVIAEQETEVFGDCWRIFNKDYEGSTKDFPKETGLQKRFIEYINSGGTFGWGYGIILYDGKKREIVNKK